MDEAVKIDSVSAAQESIGTELLRALYDEVANLRTPWVVTPQQQQQEIIDRLRSQVEQAVKNAVTRLATGGFNFVVAQVESLTIKDEAKAVLLLSRGTEAMHTLADNVGSRAVIVFADPTDYTDGMHVIKAQADQPPLPLDD